MIFMKCHYSNITLIANNYQSCLKLFWRSTIRFCCALCMLSRSFKFFAELVCPSKHTLTTTTTAATLFLLPTTAEQSSNFRWHLFLSYKGLTTSVYSLWKIGMNRLIVWKWLLFWYPVAQALRSSMGLALCWILEPGHQATVMVTMMSRCKLPIFVKLTHNYYTMKVMDNILFTYLMGFGKIQQHHTLSHMSDTKRLQFRLWK